ncbi:two-component regulator propeller domain-containing protein [Bacteroidota bacterium]
MKNLFKIIRILINSLIVIIFLSCEKQVSISQPEHEVSKNKILIETIPSGSKIFIGNDNTGKVTPDSIIFLESAIYQVILRRDLFIDTTFMIDLTTDSVKNIFLNYYEDPRYYGFINCITDPSGCDIYINDSLTEYKTPHLFDFVWPGYYEVKYTYPVHRHDSTRVTVSAQDTSLADLTLQDTTYAVDYSNYNSSFPTSFTWQIAIDNESTKWVATREDGVVLYDDKNWTIYNTENSILPSNSITSLFVDSRNRKWIGTTKGLVLVDGNNQWSLFTTQNSSIPNDYINEIAEDSKGTIWIGASTPADYKGLVKLENGIFTSYEIDKIITAMTIDNFDRVWIGIDDHIKVFDGNEWLNELTDNLPIQGRLIDALGCDQEGRVFFGIRRRHREDPYNPFYPDGLYYFNIFSGELNYLFQTMVSHVNVTENDNIWICVYGKFPIPVWARSANILYKIDRSLNVTAYTGYSSTIRPNNLICSAEQANGDMWFASRFRGIVKFKKANL